MNARQLTESLSVSPQISVEDIADIAAAGFKTIICNRPDDEVPSSHQAAAIGAAAAAAGLSFETFPLIMPDMTPENAAHQADLIAKADGPVLAYCRSGTRCTVIWAIGQAADHPADAIIAQAAKAGYDLSNMKPTLEALSQG